MPKKTPPDRHNFVNAWLKAVGEPRYTKFKCTILKEDASERGTIEKLLAQSVFVHHHFVDSYKKNLAVLGYAGAAKTLDRRPKSVKTRMGNFGEVVATEVLKQLKGYTVPIYRLRHSMNAESSPKGDDVLAFEFEDRTKGIKDSIIVAEVKTRSTHQKEAVAEAHEALTKVYRPHPNSLTFIADALRREGDDAMADKVLGFLNEFRPTPYKKRSVLFLVTGNSPRDPFGCVEELDTVASDLEAVLLHLEDIGVFVKRIFEVEVDISEL